MNRSEQINELAAALSKFQAEVTNPRKTAKVSMGYKDGNGKWQKKEYAYSPLDEIINGVKPFLAKNGLSFIQNPNTSDSVKVTTLLMHSSGQWLESEVTEIKPNDNKPQSIGSAISYARRYSLCAMLGIASEEDDDASIAQGMNDEPQRNNQTRPPQPPPPVEPQQDSPYMEPMRETWKMLNGGDLKGFDEWVRARRNEGVTDERMNNFLTNKLNDIGKEKTDASRTEA